MISVKKKKKGRNKWGRGRVDKEGGERMVAKEKKERGRGNLVIIFFNFSIYFFIIITHTNFSLCKDKRQGKEGKMEESLRPNLERC